MTRQFIEIGCVAIFSFLIGFSSYHAGKASVYSSHTEYYFKTEALLDSINNCNQPFMEAVMRTDTYYEYEKARENFINNPKDGALSSNH